MSSRKRRAETRRLRAEIDARSEWGRPGDNAYIAHMGMHLSSEEPPPTFHVREIIFAFIFLCAVSAMALFVIAPEMAKSSKPAIATQTSTKTAAPAQRKISGKITTVTDRLDDNRSRSSASRGGWYTLIPQRWVTVNDSDVYFKIPPYLVPLLWDTDLLAAKHVEIEYKDVMQKRLISGYTTDEYYNAISLKVDGTTYLTPFIYYSLGSPINWILLILISLHIGSVLLRRHDAD